jgi:Protein of unknown function (DUF2934)
MAMAGNDEELGAEEMDAVRDTAYFLWEQAGRPEGRASEFWLAAIEQHRRNKAYQRWFDEGQQARAPE